MTTAILTQTLAAIKGVNADQIKNMDTAAGTFELGACIYAYELTKSGKMVKTGSVKYFTTIQSYNNCSY